MNHLHEAIKHLEMARLSAYKALSEERAIQEEIPLGRILPECFMEFANFSSFQATKITYEGRLPLYKDEKKYKQAIKDYYIGATIQAVRESTNVRTLDKAVVLISHYFGNGRIIRDLDNRNRSYLINAIRYAGLIKDDSWKQVVLMEEGMVSDDGKDRVELHVFEQQYLIQFLQERHVKTD